MNVNKPLLPVLFSLLAFSAINTANAKTIDTPNASYSDPSASTVAIAFKPQPSKNTQIGYGAWSELLGDIILFMGPSTRTEFKSPIRETGTRISRTHNSPFRLEGNKVLYPYIRSNVKKAIVEYVTELEDLGNRIDIPAMPRNEQLAYWINLHNAVVIREVADNYPGPKRRPQNIRPLEGSDAKLHDAKLLTVDGVKLSLREIREKIVYPNWSNPDVALAFYLGDSSSPSLSNEAYTASKLRDQILANAKQYANSLRGMQKGKVSRIYHDIAPWYFSDFKNDLETYFRTRMRDEVFGEYVNAGYRGVHRYDNVVNDLTAGYGERGQQRLAASSDREAFALGKDVQEFLVERSKKIELLRKKPWFKRGTVTIIDIETKDTEVE